MKNIARCILELENRGESFVLITMTDVKGSAPQDLGAKAIVTLEGLQAGTVGGGKVEARSIETAKEILKTKTEILVTHTWNLQKDIGMSCGGEVTMLFEPRLINQGVLRIFGAGHVAQAFVRTVRFLDCKMYCYDMREEWLNKLPEQNNLVAVKVDQFSDKISEMKETDFFISLTKGHDSDLPVLKEIYKCFNSPKYVGVIGSEIKGKKLKAQLAEFGIARGQVDQIHCPIGLEIGGNDPSEIAISIAAQVLKLKS